ncbi:WAS/WASL-interacting protein family member 3-like [Sorghum bicolor]|uniref:WAS/WASL-interacting protein family member 3-like n=1 Tax=Sorghum bicolor TaxID=4558 RepID=UPI000B425664|nr:WAS/WASL-interacting protein family member 3-like [Sorghum bicolor]|eukprot:XP_021315295.1 WAS/WASL-interacting protein family member 3-like [Sorghum bicolor]
MGTGRQAHADGRRELPLEARPGCAALERRVASSTSRTSTTTNPTNDTGGRAAALLVLGRGNMPPGVGAPCANTNSGSVSGCGSVAAIRHRVGNALLRVRPLRPARPDPKIAAGPPPTLGGWDSTQRPRSPPSPNPEPPVRPSAAATTRSARPSSSPAAAPPLCSATAFTRSRRCRPRSPIYIPTPIPPPRFP